MDYAMSEPATERSELVKLNESVIHVVNQLFQDAIQKHVSDIHIEPYDQHCRIRFRQNGLLHEVTTLPLPLATQITARLKMMANLNIAEKRLPQDGHIPLRHTQQMDIRISTCPTLFGEKIVLRLLNSKTINMDIDALGFTEIQKKLFLSKLAQPQGLILVTGPTGSGKTVTLYSALHYLNQIEKNIVTVEDPIEIELKGINQVHVNIKIGLDTATILRSCLRQDPDIIMIGEIRDRDTATLALAAAQTGHLVLSTLHTNSAIESMLRLQQLGITADQLIPSLTLIIAQRLVRQLCPHCKEVDASGIGYQPIGCHNCYKGFKGRTGIFELIPMTQTIASSLLSGHTMIAILQQINKEKLMLLKEAGHEKIACGITTLREIKRVLTI
ncbi:MAG: hypothetical protein A3F42_03720 [Gammaproteobacteria bacterium RIFCSPHIGHO2_12_FULL_37_34]|nr:MAG: hypothetical protein A3F42_03720 [Gammaproteobacteria bacterium RIFCSPHIGHO2_12_FULL_37_34]